MRFRHNNDKTTYPEEYGTEDIGRMRTQREFLKAAAKQILSGDNLLKIDDIMKVVFENVETNVKMEDIIKYIPSATEFNPENIKSEMLPGKLLNITKQLSPLHQVPMTLHGSLSYFVIFPGFMTIKTSMKRHIVI